MEKVQTVHSQRSKCFLIELDQLVYDICFDTPIQSLVGNTFYISLFARLFSQNYRKNNVIIKTAFSFRQSCEKFDAEKQLTRLVKHELRVDVDRCVDSNINVNQIFAFFRKRIQKVNFPLRREKNYELW